MNREMSLEDGILNVLKRDHHFNSEDIIGLLKEAEKFILEVNNVKLKEWEDGWYDIDTEKKTKED